ncbi:hypothetical protein KXV25_002581 [Aspergillus fumigatus]|nr:hypothetical protein KXX39_002315 [Aspergillus fumigatus]KAH2981803.1 hypothetical protein KXV25_002581 [Aspergillus fumigatus]KAH3500854.1 hypothetical protein KXW24_000252 [Aspergillus fumigatus]
MASNGCLTPSELNGQSNGHINGATNGYSNGHISGLTNGYADGHVDDRNGHANGYTDGHIEDYTRHEDHKPPAPVAICGMGMRLPGGIRDEQSFYEFLINKGDARSSTPNDRYNVDAYYSPHGKHGTVITKHGYFLKDTDLTQFDPSMFSITAAEAEQLDPSQQENQEHIKAIVDIRVVISISAPLDTNAPELRIPRPRTFIGTRPPPPREAEARIRTYIKNILPGAIRTESKPTAEMWELVLCVSQQAYLPRLFGVKGSGQKAALSGIMESLVKWKEERGKGLPALWIVHGIGDTMIPPVCSTGFVQRLREVLPSIPARLDVLLGEHLFDVDITMEEEWVTMGRGFLEHYWP